MVFKTVNINSLSKEQRGHALTYSTRYFAEEIPRYEIPDGSIPANVAYQLCHDELNLDGNPSLNLASFVTTWMEPEAEKLIVETLNKNLVDRDEYPQTQVIQERCVNMIARLYNIPENCTAAGTATIGSSEAVMLAALSHKWNWRQQRKGQAADKPNIVMGGDIQVVWEKYARFFDVEPRVLPMSKDSYILNPDDVFNAVDENTTCVVGVLGTTFTGQLDPIAEINERLVDLKRKSGQDVPIHVDAASGGYVVPFTQPQLPWDFRLEQVKSINVSGHKFGLVYPGIGWVIWKDESLLPDDLVFKVNYLGGEMPTFNLNFSRGSSHVIAQYYNFLRLGKEGYRRIMTNLMKNASYLASRMIESGLFEMLSEDHSIPIAVAKLKGDPGFSVFDLSAKLRQRGWIVPAYTLPPDAESVAVLRVVVRESFSRDLADILMKDITAAAAELEKSGPCGPEPEGSDGLHHKIC